MFQIKSLNNFVFCVKLLNRASKEAIYEENISMPSKAITIALHALADGIYLALVSRSLFRRSSW